MCRDQSPSYNSVQPSTSVNDKEGTVKQGTCSTETYSQYKLQNDLEDVSLTEKFSLPQRMMGVRDISSKTCIDAWDEKDSGTISDEGVNGGLLENTLYGSIRQCESSQCRLNDVLEESLESCNEQVGFVANPNLHTSNPALATIQESFVCGNMEKEQLCFTRPLLSFEGNVSYA